MTTGTTSLFVTARIVSARSAARFTSVAIFFGDDSVGLRLNNQSMQVSYVLSIETAG